MTGNREYRSDTFSLLMQIPEYALEVYNPLNHTHYDNPDDIMFQQLNHSFSLTVRNDASFIIDSYFNLYEHQTTYNPNMPLRSLVYFSDYVKDYIKNREIFGSRLVKIPTPRFAVFYNGEKWRPERQVLLLSDAFVHSTDDPELELVCTVYNINSGHNRELLKHCPVLRKYMVFTHRVRYLVRKLGRQQGIPDGSSYMKTEKGKQILAAAINEAIDYCIEHDILREFFQIHRAEVEKSMVLDYTYEHRIELLNEEIIRSREEGISQGLYNLVHTLQRILLTPEDIWRQVIQNPDYSDVTLEQVKGYME